MCATYISVCARVCVGADGKVQTHHSTTSRWRIKRHSPRDFLLVAVDTNIGRSNDLFVIRSPRRSGRCGVSRAARTGCGGAGTDIPRDADRLLPPETLNYKYQFRSIFSFRQRSPLRAAPALAQILARSLRDIGAPGKSRSSWFLSLLDNGESTLRPPPPFPAVDLAGLASVKSSPAAKSMPRSAARLYLRREFKVLSVRDSISTWLV